MMKQPDEQLNCLLVQPLFAKNSYWNYLDSCQLIGAKTPAPPLGLITVAAILPQHWTFKLMDLNACEFSSELWNWADIICVGGMLPQQKGIIDVIDRAKREGKFVAVGGADPSSQPELYQHADVLVVGEGETVIPMWMESWKKGQPRGRFESADKPDVTKTPVPRFDLLNLPDYNQMNVQYSRGCPFNCEFCDIIELYGRKPRTKTPQQIIAELETLRNLGYRGHVDLVDDNFIGNKRLVKAMLPELIAWSKSKGYPFFYSTEASMNLADDVKLMELMQEADFRFIFMGIESPDPELLLMTQKSQNTMKPIVERVHKLYEYGMIALAGFIMGFDNEKANTDISMVKCIEETGICMAMIGLLVALPNTQLTRRLKKEGRLISFSGDIVGQGSTANVAIQEGATAEVIDQTTAGLNFVTTRDRVEIMREYMNAVRTVYEPKLYFARVMRTVRMLNGKGKHLPWGFELKRSMRGLYRMCSRMTKHPKLRGLFWRNFAEALFMGPKKMEAAMRLMGIYLHFEKQTEFIMESMQKQIDLVNSNSFRFPRVIEKPLVPKSKPLPLAADRPREVGLHAG